MIPGLAASRPPQVGTPTRPHPPRPGTFLGGLPLPPSFPPPTFSSHLVAAGFPKRLGRVQRDKLSGKRETGAGEIRGRLGAAPAPRRVPGRRAANSRPGDDSRSGASGRRPPGQRELGRERGAGDRRARARGLARAVPEKGTRPAVKGAIPSGLLGPTGRGPGNELQTQKNEQGAGIRVCYRRLRNGASRGGPLRGLRPGARARRRLQAEPPVEPRPGGGSAQAPPPGARRRPAALRAPVTASLLRPARPSALEFAGQLPQVLWPSAVSSGQAPPNALSLSGPQVRQPELARSAASGPSHPRSGPGRPSRPNLAPLGLSESPQATLLCS